MISIKNVSILFLVSAQITSCTLSNDGGSNADSSDESYSESRRMKLNPVEYVQYVRSPESGLHAVINESNLQLNAQYQPVDYCMLMESGTNYSKKLLDSLRPEYDGGSYFKIDVVELYDNNPDTTIRITHLKGNQMLSEYFGYKVQNDLSLIQNDDTIPCQMSHFLDYGTAGNKMSLLCVFPKLKNTDVVVLWKDSVIFNKTHQFHFKKQNIEYINSVNLQL